MHTIVLPDLPMTAADFAAMAPVHGLRMELNDGALEVATAAQMAWHSRTAHRIAGIMQRDSRRALTAPGITLSPRKVRLPDVVRFRPGIVIDDFASQFDAADVDPVVEVVSPESRQRDVEVKPREYRVAGIPEMWIVTPHKIPGDMESDALITVHRFDVDEAPVTHLPRELEG